MPSINLLILCLLAPLSCHHASKQDGTPSTDDVASFAAVQARALTFLDEGFIVSRDPSGSAKGQGDGLIFTGLALYAMSCASGEPLAAALEKMLQDQDGGVYRHPSLTSKAPSLDGLLGLYRGISKRVLTCGEKGRWAKALALHETWLKGSGLEPPGFSLVSDTVFAEVGFKPSPAKDRELELATILAGWVAADRAAKGACFRLNLSLIALQTVETLYPYSNSLFCDAATGVGIPLIEQFCAKPGLADWLSAYKPDVWQYQFQRCPAWETPDGNGDSQPGIDYLVAWADYFGTPK